MIYRLKLAQEQDCWWKFEVRQMLKLLGTETIGEFAKMIESILSMRDRSIVWKSRRLRWTMAESGCVWQKIWEEEIRVWPL